MSLESSPEDSRLFLSSTEWCEALVLLLLHSDAFEM
jgi:hypothetical protein